MKTMMKLLALVMSMLMVLSMVACTNDANTTDPGDGTAPSSSTEGTKPGDDKPNDSKPNEDKPVEDTKKEYTVIVKDASGNPLSGVMVQICKEGSTCFTPRRTDDNGCAVWSLDVAADYYGTVSSLEEGMPKEYFGDKFEVTLVYEVPAVNA